MECFEKESFGECGKNYGEREMVKSFGLVHKILKNNLITHTVMNKPYY